MKIEIDLSALSSDERYELRKGLEAVKKPSISCKAAIVTLTRLASESYNQFLRDNPDAILRAFGG